MNRFFGHNIEPHCEYCSLGRLSMDGKCVLCKYKGVVGLGFSCRRYRYDPLLRRPMRAARMMDFEPEDFVL